MVRKAHIQRLPSIKIDTSYPRDSEKVTVSLPIFHSAKGWVGNFDADKNFDMALFKDVVCKGAVWVAHSIATNTDLCENGVPIYFHVEDVIFDAAVEVLSGFGVPKDWIRKTHFEEPTNDILHTRYGKKLGCFSDTELKPDTWLLWDADAFVYRPLGDSTYKWHHFFDGGELSEKMGTSFYSEHNGGDASFVNWIRLAAGLPSVQGEPAPERLQQGIAEAYAKLELNVPETQYRYGAAIMSLPREHPLKAFLVKHTTDCYPEEALVSAWMNSVGCQFVEFSKLWNMPLLSNSKAFADHKGGSFAHPSQPANDPIPLDSYYSRFRNGIDGRNRKSISATKRKRKRIIVFGVPHTPASGEHFFSHCAFAQKARKLCTMMHNLGHEVIYFGNELCEVDCTEHVAVTTAADLEEFQPDFRESPNVTKHGPEHFIYKKFYLTAEYEYRKRALPDDLLCYVIGWQLKPLYNALQDLPVHHIESGIGYYNAYMQFKVFESAAVRDFTYGGYEKNYHQHQASIQHLTEEQKKQYPLPANTHVHHSWPQWQDTIIPNSFYVDEFKYNPNVGGDYFLYIGRIMRGKGIEEAMRISDALGKILIVAGVGDFKANMGFDPWDCVEIIGPVGAKDRMDLYYNAEMVFCISHYPEPFGGTVIESALSGRPTLTSVFGAHHTNVKHGKTGFRMHYYDDGLRFARQVDTINPADCREWGLQFSNENVAKLYDEYFDRVLLYAQNGNSMYWASDPSITGIDGLVEGF